MKPYCIFLACSILFINLAFGASAPGTATLRSPTAQIEVSATVQKFCTIRSDPFTFEQIGSQGLAAQVVVVVTCTAGTVYYLGVSQIDNAITDSNNDILVYSVYQNSQSARSPQALGNAINKNTISGVGNGTPQTLTLYAAIQSSQPIIPGSYEGKLHVTLSF